MDKERQAKVWSALENIDIGHSLIGDHGTHPSIGKGEKISTRVHLKPTYWLLVIGDHSICQIVHNLVYHVLGNQE